MKTIECNDDAMSFDIEYYLEEVDEFEDVGRSGSDAQDGLKPYYITWITR